MYIILWDDGETEYYAIRKDLLHRIYFLQTYCGYRFGRDYQVAKLLDGVTIHYDTIPDLHEIV